MDQHVSSPAAFPSSALVEPSLRFALLASNFKPSCSSIAENIEGAEESVRAAPADANLVPSGENSTVVSELSHMARICHSTRMLQ
jgi:hypothetical protein